MKYLTALLILLFSTTTPAETIFVSTYNISVGISMTECIKRLENVLVKVGASNVRERDEVLVEGSIDNNKLSIVCIDFTGKTNDSATGNLKDNFSEGFVLTSIGPSLQDSKVIHKAILDDWKRSYPVNYKDMEAAHENFKKLFLKLSEAFKESTANAVRNEIELQACISKINKIDTLATDYSHNGSETHITQSKGHLNIITKLNSNAIVSLTHYKNSGRTKAMIDKRLPDNSHERVIVEEGVITSTLRCAKNSRECEERPTNQFSLTLTK